MYYLSSLTCLYNPTLRIPTTYRHGHVDKSFYALHGLKAMTYLHILFYIGQRILKHFGRDKLRTVIKITYI